MTGEVRLERSIRASRAELWRACSTAKGLEGWYADRVTGPVSRGRPLRVEWPELGAGVDLDVLDVVPNEQIVFDNGESRVRLRVDQGRIELVHSGLDADDELDGFRSSWHVALSLLAHGLEEHPGRARRTSWFARRVRTSTDLAYLCFTEPEMLARWLGEARAFGSEGDDYALRLISGGAMTGRVLARGGGRDVALSWQEQGDSVVVLRTFPSPGGGASGDERIIAASWSRWAEAPGDEAAAGDELRRAVERLGATLQRSGVG